MKRFLGYYLVWLPILVFILSGILVMCAGKPTQADGPKLFSNRVVLSISPDCTAKELPGRALAPNSKFRVVDGGSFTLDANCIQKIEPDYLIEADDLDPQTADPLLGQQWGTAKIKAPEAWYYADGSSVVVAVLDTGMDFTHPDLRGRAVSTGIDYANNDTNATDDHGHGTHVSGTIAALYGNGEGGAGVAWGARILPVKVLQSTGSGSMIWLSDGIRWAADQPGVRVMNASLGCPGCVTDYVQDAINYAASKGIVFVAAAGNNNSSQPHYPAAHMNAVAVGATTQNDTRASFSNYGSWVDLSAPGDQITSTKMGGGYVTWSGTSMASPHVAAAAAVLFSQKPGRTAADVIGRLTDGEDIGNQQIGKRLNLLKAINAPAPPSYTPAPTAIMPTATPPPASNWSRQVFDLVNAERTRAGLAPLRWDDRIYQAAQKHNERMDDCKQANPYGNCLSHQLPGEPDPNVRVRSEGYPAQFVLEDIGTGYQSPEAMVRGWMGSPGHRAAILDTRIDAGAAAFLDGTGTGNYMGLWWTWEGVKTNGVGSPLPTPTPERLPRGYCMIVTYDYSRISPHVIDEAYWKGAQPYLNRGVLVRWDRKAWGSDVYVMTIKVDYNIAPKAAADINWEIGAPWLNRGVVMSWPREACRP